MYSGEYSVLGRYPWNNRVEETDRIKKATFFPGQDSMQEINKCLVCRKEECNNCLCKDKTFLAMEMCEALLKQRKTEQQICALMHISRSTLFRYKTALAI